MSNEEKRKLLEQKRQEERAKLDEILGEPWLVLRVTGRTTGDTFSMDFDQKTARVGSRVKRSNELIQLAPYEDGGGLVNRIDIKQVRVYHAEPHQFIRVAEIVREREEEGPKTKPKTAKQSRGLMRSYARFAGGDKSGPGLFMGKDLEKDKDGNVILKKIPHTAMLLALEFFRLTQIKATEMNNEGYIKLPPILELCRNTGLFADNSDRMMKWLRFLDWIQIPLISEEPNNRQAIENHKLCQIRFVYRNTITGDITHDNTTDEKVKGRVLEDIWVRLDDRLLKAIDNPPKGFGYTIMPDDFSFLLHNLSNQLARKLCSYIFSQPVHFKRDEENLIKDLGLEEERAKQGAKKIQKNLRAAFEELISEGFLQKWGGDTGARGQVVYNWTREEYGGSKKKELHKIDWKQVEIKFSGSTEP